SLSKTTLFANSCRLHQFGRTSSSLATVRQCLDSGTVNNKTNCLIKVLNINFKYLGYINFGFPSTAILGTQISRNASTSGDHVRLWVLERVVSTALPFLIPAALITENSILEGIMGLEAIITDYARPSVLGPVLPKILHFSLLIVSAVTLCGLFVLINNGPGVSRAVKDAWAIGKTPPRNKPIVEE
ncbi:unnamed protein product, partial [Heterotrigona itama]